MLPPPNKFYLPYCIPRIAMVRGINFDKRRKLQ
jgi:hypothetical protein